MSLMDEERDREPAGNGAEKTPEPTAEQNVVLPAAPLDAKGGFTSDEPDPQAVEEAKPVSAPVSESGFEVNEAITTSAEDTEAADQEMLAQSRRHTRRSFVLAAAGAAAAYGFYHWLNFGPQEEMQPDALRHAFQFDAGVSRHVLDEDAFAPTYPLERAKTLRVNGIYGLKKELVPDSYRLQVVGVRNAASHPRFSPDVTAWNYQYTAEQTTESPGHDTKVAPAQQAAGQAPAGTASAPTKTPAPESPVKQAAPMMSSSKMAPEKMMAKCEEDENHTGRKPRGMEEAGESFSTLPPGTSGLLLTMNDVLQLPRHELVTQFKCIEGWSQIVHWAGVRFADFLDAYPPALIDGKEPKYLYMETPDGDYYVGYDLQACRHPQMLLVTEMMGAPLTQFHGAPLRLHTPARYGYKQIKRIALIYYTNEKPDDYWTELGYDWYAGL